MIAFRLKPTVRLELTMLLNLLVLLSIEQADRQASEPTRATPAKVQQCPDGTVVLATQVCPIYPSHGFLMTHAPQRRELVERWWCGQSPQPHEARISIELRQPVTPRGSPYYVYRLASLSVGGRPAPAKLIKTVREKVVNVHGLYPISSRCLHVSSGGTVGVLVLQHFADGKQQPVEIELR